MTAQQIYEQDIRQLSAIERLRLARLILDRLTDSPEVERELAGALEVEIRRSTPPDAVLLELAAKNPPPQSWWDESADPFSPDQDGK